MGLMTEISKREPFVQGVPLIQRAERMATGSQRGHCSISWKTRQTCCGPHWATAAYSSLRDMRIGCVAKPMQRSALRLPHNEYSREEPGGNSKGEWHHDHDCDHVTESGDADLDEQE